MTATMLLQLPFSPSVQPVHVRLHMYRYLANIGFLLSQTGSMLWPVASPVLLVSSESAVLWNKRDLGADLIPVVDILTPKELDQEHFLVPDTR